MDSNNALMYINKGNGFYRNKSALHAHKVFK